MNKYKEFTALIVSLLLAVSLIGCGNAMVNEVTPGGESEDSNIDAPYEDNDLGEDGEDIDFGLNGDFQTFIEDSIEGLTKDEYPDLVVTVAILERMAILPGSTVRVNVAIENRGEETIAFVKGSGSNIVPDALLMSAEGLQPIVTAGTHGMIATMDFNIEILEPGESLNFNLYVKVIEPNINFDDYTFKLLEDGKDIANVDWGELNSMFPDLVKAAPGHYTINVYFLYKVVGEGDFDMFGVSPTGFNVGTIELTVD